MLAMLAAHGCGEDSATHCGNADGGYFSEWDYNHGDRCPLQISSTGSLEIAPSQLDLAPAVEGQPSAAELTIIGYAEGSTDKAGPKTYADGYVVDIELQPDCSLLLSLDSSPTADVCLVEAPTHLRCLLDPLGVTSVVVSTLLDHPTASNCELIVRSGEAEATSRVSVAHDSGAIELAIHVAGEGPACGSADSPCEPPGGVLPESVCTGSSACSDSPASIALYLATEIEGVQAVIPREMSVQLRTNPQEYPAAPAFFSSTASCANKITSTAVTEAGESMTVYLCTDGQPGTHEIRVWSSDSTMTDSVFVNVPAIPAELTVRRDGTGTESFGYVFDVWDCEGQPLSEELLYGVDGKQPQGITSGVPFFLEAEPNSFVVELASWERSCLLDPPQ